MVFKVKQRGQTQYEDMIVSQVGETTKLNFSGDGKNIANSSNGYKLQYNWPYDYFSLVELVSLDAAVDYSFKERQLSEQEARVLSLRKKEEEL